MTRLLRAFVLTVYAASLVAVLLAVCPCPTQQQAAAAEDHSCCSQTGLKARAAECCARTSLDAASALHEAPVAVLAPAGSCAAWPAAAPRRASRPSLWPSAASTPPPTILRI